MTPFSKKLQQMKFQPDDEILFYAFLVTAFPDLFLLIKRITTVMVWESHFVNSRWHCSRFWTVSFSRKISWQWAKLSYSVRRENPLKLRAVERVVSAMPQEPWTTAYPRRTTGFLVILWTSFETLLTFRVKWNPYDWGISSADNFLICFVSEECGLYDICTSHIRTGGHVNKQLKSFFTSKDCR